ncbi:hypothetical protein ACFWF3_01945 [Nocardia sp. NPDC060220]|uniref:hypothetical protein n=1 Tax=Nocardia sp. NPDC060220 TaxID=3347076 RepID=UPI00365EF0E0
MSKLSGFTLDLQDIGANFTENAGRLLPGLALPAGTAGQLAQLSVSIQKLQTTLSGDHQKDTSALGTLGSGLGTAATAYKNSDEQHAVSINQAAASLTDGQGVAATSQAGDVRRFTGLQQPSLQNVEEAQYTVRQVVTGCVGLLTSYDEPLGRTIGIKPVPITWRRWKRTGRRCREWASGSACSASTTSPTRRTCPRAPGGYRPTGPVQPRPRSELPRPPSDSRTTTIQRISGALGYESGRATPVYNASEFELPEKVIVDLGAIRYGYGDNVWFEHAVSV